MVFKAPSGNKFIKASLRHSCGPCQNAPLARMRRWRKNLKCSCTTCTLRFQNFSPPCLQTKSIILTHPRRSSPNGVNSINQIHHSDTTPELGSATSAPAPERAHVPASADQGPFPRLPRYLRQQGKAPNGFRVQARMPSLLQGSA